jgi:hypothetical protein
MLPISRLRFVCSTTALALALLGGTSVSLNGQSLSEAEIRGTIRTTAGEVIPRAEVSLLTGSGVAIRSLAGGLDGSFVVRGVGAGVYTLRVEALGFSARIYTGIRLRPGVAIRLPVVLVSGAGGVVDTVAAAGAGTPPTAGRWVEGPELTRLPGAVPTLEAWANLSTLVDDELGMQGLPGQFTRLSVDGLPFRPVRPFGSRSLARGGALFSPRSLSAMRLLGDPATTELTPGAGGQVAMYATRGTGVAGITLDGAGSAGAMRGAATDPDEAPDALSFWGGATARVVVSPDTSSLAVGADVWQVERPRAGLLASSTAAEDGLDRPYLDQSRAFSAFARFDQMMSGGGVLWGSGRVAIRQATNDLAGMAWGLEDTGERVDLMVGAGGMFAVGRRETLEVRLGVSRSAWTSASTAGITLPFGVDALTAVDAGTGERVGPGTLPAGTASRLDGDASLTLHLPRNRHQFKLGLQGGGSSHSQDGDRVVRGLGIVGSGSATGPWAGLVRATGFGGPVSASVPRVGVFGEDVWSLSPQATLVFGARFNSEWLPITGVTASATWFLQSGLVAPTLAEQVTGGTGYLGIQWDGGQGTRFMARGSYSNDEFDPAVLTEMLASTEYGAYNESGSQVAWPGVPQPVSARRSKPAYAYLTRSPEAPTTVRVGGALAQSVGGGSFEAAAVFRRTEGLTRRRDLNRPILPWGRTANGRDLWNAPGQIGSWLGADPVTVGRFSSFGPVWELDQGGWSEYLGVTARLSSGNPGGVRWSAEYTWSRTEDNVPGLGGIGRVFGVELAAASGEGATAGISDLDRPHRAVGIVAIPLPFGDATELSGVYRFQSGAPFTPGYAAGVDANLDGVIGNDPAFVTIAADAAHGAEWSCVASAVGGFVSRNSCRAPDMHTLDLRLSVELPGPSVSLVFDALNVLDREVSLLDPSLLAVDAAGSVTGGPANAQLPVVANPGFGSSLRDLSLGRTLRVGLRIGR